MSKIKKPIETYSTPLGGLIFEIWPLSDANCLYELKIRNVPEEKYIGYRGFLFESLDSAKEFCEKQLGYLHSS